eukprot:4995146-Lingulodinium_polyedra.AAC.1
MAQGVDAPAVVEQDLRAGLLAKVILNLVRVRMVSYLQSTRAFPQCLAALLHPDEDIRGQLLAWMQDCYKGWQALSKLSGPPEEIRAMLRRSWFQQLLVKETFAHLLATGFDRELPPALKELLGSAFSGIGQSKVVEDGIKVISEAASANPNKKLGARQKWARLAQSHVLAGLHRFTALTPRHCSVP